jgi:hypothetical protein
MRMKQLTLAVLLFSFLINSALAQSLTRTARPSESPRTVIAVLDSGISTRGLVEKGLNIKSFDLTGEGPDDLNGHGTMVTNLLLQTLPSSTVTILNVKILDKHKKTDEVTLLRGLYVASENGARMINLSAGVWVRKEDAEQFVRKFLQWGRRYPDAILSGAAGNRGTQPKDPGSLFLPQEADSVVDSIEPKNLHQDVLNDAIYVAKAGKFKLANDLLIQLISQLPDEQLEERALRLRTGLIYTEFAHAYRARGDAKLSDAFSARAKKQLEGIESFDVLLKSISSRKSE